MKRFFATCLALLALVFAQQAAFGAAAYYQPTASLTALANYGHTSPLVAHADVVGFSGSTYGGGARYDWQTSCAGVVDGFNFIASNPTVGSGCWARTAALLQSAPSYGFALGAAAVTSWGDSLTQGVGTTSTGSSDPQFKYCCGYPIQLQTIYGRTTYHNAGISSQTSTQIATRMGAYSAQNTVTVTGASIPTSGGVTVTFTVGKEPVTTNGPLAVHGTISGVPGNVTGDGGSPTPVLTFTRDTPGSAVPVSGLVPFVVDAASLLAGINVIWEGRNSFSDISGTEAAIAASVAVVPNSNYIILAILNGAGQGTGTTAYTQITTINNNSGTTYCAVVTACHYFDIREWLVQNGLQEAGITPTSQDLTDIANDIVPTSLRFDTEHLNSAGYAVVARQVMNFITGQLSNNGQNYTLTPVSGAQLLATPPAIGGLIPAYGSFTGLSATTIGINVAAPALTTTTPFVLYGGDGATVPVSAEVNNTGGSTGAAYWDVRANRATNSLVGGIRFLNGATTSTSTPLAAITGTTAGSNTTGSLDFYTSGVDALTIDSSQNATFLGQVVSNNSFFVTKTDGTEYLGFSSNVATNTLGGTIKFSNGGAGTSYAAIIATVAGSNTAGSLDFYTSNSDRLTIASTGAATFAGTVSASSGFIGPLTGTASLASNVAGGAGGQLLYQSAANTTGAITNGSAGQILRAAGGTTVPAWSTATYPATAGTAANVLRSDGTNFLSAALTCADLSGGCTFSAQATNTVMGNATSGSAVPTALAVGSCSSASSALIWTTNTGFGCNTSITAAAVPASGLTGATLAAGVTASSLTSVGNLTSLTNSGTETVQSNLTTAITVGTGSAASVAGITINGGTNSNTGPTLNFQRNGSTKGQIGTVSGVVGGSPSDMAVLASSGLGLRLYSNAGNSSLILDTNGLLTMSGGLASGGSAPTLTGTCTTGSQTGGNTAGTFTATCTAQTVIITFANTAPNGWACNAHDRTTPADALNQTASSTTSCTLTGTTVAADVISFDSRAY